MIIELTNWAVGGTIGFHKLPLDGQKLNGEVRNHSYYDDGTFTITSEIVNIKGHIVETKGGLLYRLIKINPIYRRWLKINFPSWDSKTPIIIRNPPMNNKEERGNGIKIKKRK